MERSFTLRVVLVGALVGVLVNLSNYYGLRVGFASHMLTVLGLLGFAGFIVFSRWTSYPLSAEENVLIISVATATRAMPVTAGLIGIIPALEYLIGPTENGPLTLNWHDLILWSIGLCLFGLIFASWVRPYFIDREDLPWPGARVTAQLVKSLHLLLPDDMVRPSDTASTLILEEEESDHEHQNSTRMEVQPLLGSTPSTEGEPENGSVKYVRLQWLDYSGVLRTRTITLATAKKVASGNLRYSLAENCMVIPISTAPACFPDGIEEWTLLPDWTSVRLCGHRDNHATVQCFLVQMGLENRFARCPRHFLFWAVDRMLMVAETIWVRFEIEFVLLDENQDATQSTDQTVRYCMPAGLRTENLDIMEEIVDALESSGIETHHFHVEGLDQFTIALSSRPLIEAVDNLMVAQETIRTITQYHGLIGTLAPKPILKGPKNGVHARISFPRITDEMGCHFLAGTLGKLRPLCAFGLANFDSYERVTRDFTDAWVGLGTGNKDLPVRKVYPTSWEFRALDATANTYIFMAALLCSCLYGLETDLQLKAEDYQILPSAPPFKKVKRQLEKQGATESMPSGLAESLAALKEDEDIKGWVGKELLTQYLRVKEMEVEYFGKMTEEERRLKFTSYF
ncbi:uncharacterized protein B0J16DRAFT_386985 [Fusarium flagelliforme]|uniref:uncharacterized protein n=1 Tax=Fusarium flagelliforme TaxID=2675880 RepID=UPI001E8CD860|nr:uncharacterized protein B0J16DRAFT_386985 [Fusarium flagelliforme]KAH7179158.1 hypothetical protein B0J16DRAFT_386985 [Fusarium flagelliforme]